MTSTPQRVTEERLRSRIRGHAFHHFPGTTVTVCLLEVDNGYTVVGKSACVDPRAFDREVGQGLAYEDAFNQLWALEGYLLAERLR